MLSFTVQAILGDHLIMIEFQDPKEFRELWPRFEANGYQPYFKALRDDISVKVTDKIFDEIGETNYNAPISCPRSGHGDSKIWNDKKKPGHKYCGHKMADGGWCGVTWDKEGVMTDRRAGATQANFGGPIEF